MKTYETVVLHPHHGTPRTVRLTKQLGVGSSGRVYAVAGHDVLAVKICHRPDEQRTEARVDAFWAMGSTWTVNRPHGLHVAWPYAKALDPQTRQTVGFAMPRMSPGHAQMSAVVGIRPQIPFRDPSWAQCLRTAAGLARAVAAASAQHAVVVDLRADNAFVTEAGTVTLIDADGWQVRNPATGEVIPSQGSHGEVTAPEYLPPTPRDAVRGQESDRWALAVMIAVLLFRGVHPFAGTRPQDPKDWEEQDHVREQLCWLLRNDMQLPAGTPPVSILPPCLYRLFESCFDEGHGAPSLRPTPDQWIAQLEATLDNLTSCAADPLHVFPSTAPRCPWCAG